MLEKISSGIYSLNPHIFDNDNKLTPNFIAEELPSPGQLNLTECVDKTLTEPTIDHDEFTRS